MSSVRGPLRRLAAALALVGLLACSGMGLCWTRFGGRGRDGCAGERMSASSGAACTSSATYVGASPFAARAPIAVVVRIETPEAQTGTAASPRPAGPAKSPPLVLRI